LLSRLDNGGEFRRTGHGYVSLNRSNKNMKEKKRNSP
jgi:hypothetical protein